MGNVLVEFINTCPTCASHEAQIKKVAGEYGDAVEVKVYEAGKDYDYVKKYGMVSKGTMIINESKKYDNLDSQVISKAIAEAVKEGNE